MICAIHNTFCIGNIHHRVFLWRYLSPIISNTKNIILPCILCDHHYNRLLHTNRGAVPETTGPNEAIALNNLLSIFEAEM